MNVLVKKSAVGRYSALHAEGKTEVEVKAAIAADAKQFKPEEVDEIYAAIVAAAQDGGEQGGGSGDQGGDDNGKENGEQGNASGDQGGDPGNGDQGSDNQGPQDPEPPSGKAPVYVVVQRFRDAQNRRKVYEAGDDVSHLDPKRLASLEEKGLVAKQ